MTTSYRTKRRIFDLNWIILTVVIEVLILCKNNDFFPYLIFSCAWVFSWNKSTCIHEIVWTCFCTTTILETEYDMNYLNTSFFKKNTWPCSHQQKNSAILLIDMSRYFLWPSPQTSPGSAPDRNLRNFRQMISKIAVVYNFFMI